MVHGHIGLDWSFETLSSNSITDHCTDSGKIAVDEKHHFRGGYLQCRPPLQFLEDLPPWVGLGCTGRVIVMDDNTTRETDPIILRRKWR